MTRVRAGFVPVGYSFNCTILTRTVCPNDATVYPVTTTGDVARPAIAADGTGGAGTGCLAGILRWG